MAFLCQVLHQLRNTDGEPFRPLVTPVYRGLEMLLDSKATDKEMEVGATQVTGNTLIKSCFKVAFAFAFKNEVYGSK